MIVIGAGHNGLVAAGYPRGPAWTSWARAAGVRRRRLHHRGVVAWDQCANVLVHLPHAPAHRHRRPRAPSPRPAHLPPGPASVLPVPRRPIRRRLGCRRADHGVTRPTEPARRAAVSRLSAVRRRLARLLHRYFLEPPPTLAELFREVDGTDDAALLERLLLGNVTDLLDEFFESPYVKALFVRAWTPAIRVRPGSLLSSTYLWTDLFTAPEDYGIVRGGMGGITQALARSATSTGRRSGPTPKWTTCWSRMAAPAAWSCAMARSSPPESSSPTRTPSAPSCACSNGRTSSPIFARRVERLRTDAAYLKFHAALDRLPDFSRYLGAEYDPRWLAYTQICPSVDYFRQSWADARAGQLSRTPLMSVQIPTVMTPRWPPTVRTSCPSGSSTRQFGPVDGSWDQLRQAAGEHLDRYAGDLCARRRGAASVTGCCSRRRTSSSASG